jgi:hypothetical protein
MQIRTQLKASLEEKEFQKFKRRTSGRIEEITLTQENGTKDATGAFRGNNLIVRNGFDYVGQKCLVRFDSRRMDRYHPVTYFITSKLKAQGSFAPERYVLCGLLDEPSFEKFDEKFNPGNTEIFFYIRANKPKSNGTLRISRYRDITSRNLSVPKMLSQEFSQPKKYPRVITSDNVDKLGNIMAAIKKYGLIPIKMQPKS